MFCPLALQKGGMTTEGATLKPQVLTFLERFGQPVVSVGTPA